MFGRAVVGGVLVDVEGGLAVVFGEGCDGLVFEVGRVLGGVEEEVGAGVGAGGRAC